MFGEEVFGGVVSGVVPGMVPGTELVSGTAVTGVVVGVPGDVVKVSGVEVGIPGGEVKVPGGGEVADET